jgi:hypothetical protein
MLFEIVPRSYLFFPTPRKKIAIFVQRFSTLFQHLKHVTRGDGFRPDPQPPAGVVARHQSAAAPGQDLQF